MSNSSYSKGHVETWKFLSDDVELGIDLTPTIEELKLFHEEIKEQDKFVKEIENKNTEQIKISSQ
jgi:hypothetical protein